MTLPFCSVIRYVSGPMSARLFSSALSLNIAFTNTITRSTGCMPFVSLVIAG